MSFNFTAAVTICSDFEPKKVKSDTVCTVSPSICHEVMGPDAMIFVFSILSFKPTFSLSFSLSPRGSLVPHNCNHKDDSNIQLSINGGGTTRYSHGIDEVEHLSHISHKI